MTVFAVAGSAVEPSATSEPSAIETALPPPDEANFLSREMTVAFGATPSHAASVVVP